LSVDGRFGRVMQNVDLPETQQDFASNALHVNTYYENRYSTKVN
jgi:hypothetical protein